MGKGHRNNHIAPVGSPVTGRFGDFDGLTRERGRLLRRSCLLKHVARVGKEIGGDDV